jgi:hypothetical protein
VLSAERTEEMMMMMMTSHEEVWWGRDFALFFFGASNFVVVCKLCFQTKYGKKYRKVNRIRVEKGILSASQDKKWEYVQQHIFARYSPTNLLLFFQLMIMITSYFLRTDSIL